MLYSINGCTGGLKKGGDETISGQGKGDNHEYDPLGLPEDRVIIAEKNPIASTAEASQSHVNDIRVPPQHYDDTDSTLNLYSTYRIQLFSSSTYGAALREQAISKEIFDKDIYLDYEVPYYKVRIGNFATRQDAEEYVPAAQQAGYNTAWVVKVALDVRTPDALYNKGNIPKSDFPDRAGDSLYTEPVPSDEFNDTVPAD